MSQVIQGATFHIEHIVPRAKGGADTEDNLALACPSCNLHKSDATDAADPLTGRFVQLFHPRRDSWGTHFEFDGLQLAGLSPEGRATVQLLGLNSHRRIAIRAIERALGLSPEEA